ncbi:ead/Ea22-like family protein [Klebsiella pneumoniae]|uniref:ead/Ea22-like family protein n=1 Tax=Klebsiella pneumoniae TaxID=573 RepID=UPI003B20DB21
MTKLNVISAVSKAQTQAALTTAARITPMTDITELAQRLKLEVHRAVSNFNPQMNIKTRDLKELVEELEKAQTINAAAEKLVRCKGRYHSEQNYRALAALFGVKTPDLPPLEHENVHYVDAAEMEIAALRQRIAELESRTVTVKLPESFKLAKSSSGLRYYYADEVDAAIIAAGIKVETE